MRLNLRCRVGVRSGNMTNAVLTAAKIAGLAVLPLLALVVSGGHTHLFLAEQRGPGWYYENVGHTRDDAAGELPRPKG